MAYVDLTARFTYNMLTAFGDYNSIGNNDKFLKDNGWEDGTVGIFLQAASPVGWTKLTTATGRGLRITSGSGGGVGGSTDIGAAISLAHTHTVANDTAHTHAVVSHSHNLDNDGVTFPSGGHKDVGTNAVTDPGGIQIVDTAGAFSVNIKQNSLSMTGSYTSGSGGAHDHGAITDSQLSAISLAYANVIFATKDTSSGYTDLSSTFVHNTRHVFDYLNEAAANDAFNYARRTPAGTVCLFGSAAAPVGWTKLATINGSWARVVSDATGGSTGGTKDPSTVITLAHTHGDLTSGGAHTHSIPNHTHNLDTFGSTTIGTGGQISNVANVLRRIDSGSGSNLPFQTTSNTDTDGGGTSSSDGAHQHAVATALTDITLAYFNSIQASKDAGGEPAAYTDMTTFFVPADNTPNNAPLLAYQDLQKMGNNDAYLYYHTMPSGAVSFFFQAAAPFNWTKLTAQNDCAVRIVSDGSGGTSGGSASVNGTITLAHQHVVDTKSHSHTLTHTHRLGRGFSTTVALDASVHIFGAAGARMYAAGGAGASGDVALKDTTASAALSTDTYSHNHSGLTGSSLSNITLAYADVIMCSKI